MKTMITASILVFAFGCANSSSDAPGGPPPVAKGKRVATPDAVTALQSVPRWCYDNTANDAFYSTLNFGKNKRGDLAVWNRTKKKYTSHDPLTWTIADDVLTITLPKTYKPNVWTAQLRFIEGGVQFWQDETTLQSVLHGCSPGAEF